MAIPLFKPSYRTEECLQKISRVLDSGWTGYGDECVKFENSWKRYTNLPHAHFLNSNTSGLHLAIEVFKRENRWPEGAEILTSPLTFIATNHSILTAGLTPRFVDVDESLSISVEQLERRLTTRCKAVIFVGLGGNVGNYLEVCEFCKSHDLILILDAAHMAGTKIDGHHVGSEADCAVFSFQAVKNLPTADSGMICFKGENHDAHARRLSWMGIDKSTFTRSQSSTYQWRYNVDEVGFKYHGNSVMASIGQVSLKYLEDDNDARRKISNEYHKNLGELAELNIVEHDPKALSSRHLFQVRSNKRDALMQHLIGRQIGTGVHYRNNLEYPMYKSQFGYAPVAEKMSNELLSLPLFPSMSAADTQKVCESIKEFFVEGKRA